MSSFRPILPQPQLSSNAARRGSEAEDVPDTSTSASTPVKRPRHKDPPVTVACGNCHTSKLKCDGRRPQCERCRKRNKICEYARAATETSSQALKRKIEDLESQNSSALKICELLVKRSDNEAREILKRMRLGMSHEDIVRQIQEGDLLLQMKLQPDDRYRYTFPYSREMPEYLQRNLFNPYLDAPYHEHTQTASSSASKGQVPDVQSSQVTEQYLKPYHAAELIEPLLDDLVVTNWTNISSDNVLLIELLKRYFLFHHQSWPFFHKDAFLRDMKSGSKRFCSSLLVNAVLAEASHGYPKFTYRNRPWKPNNNLCYSFIAEARRLWELENDKNRITTIQAAMILSLCMSADGIDKAGKIYVARAVTMAHEMQLFSSKERSDPEVQNVCDFTAWAVFNWQAENAFRYRVPSACRQPPQAPLPDPGQHSEWYGEIQYRYSSSFLVWRAYLPHTFFAQLRFRVILNDFVDNTYRTKRDLSLDEGLVFCERLSSWLQDLPGCLKPQNIVLPVHLKIHVHYYDFLLNLFEGFASVEIPMEKSDSALSSPSSLFPRPSQSTAAVSAFTSPAKVLSNAKLYIESLLRLYYLRHGYEVYDSMLIYFVFIWSYMAGRDLKNNKLSSSEENGAVSSLALALEGAHLQAEHSYAGRVFVTLMRQNIDPKYANLIQRAVFPDPDDRENIILKYMQSSLPMNVLNLADDLSKQPLEVLLRQLTTAEPHSSGEDDI